MFTKLVVAAAALTAAAVATAPAQAKTHIGVGIGLGFGGYGGPGYYDDDYYNGDVYPVYGGGGYGGVSCSTAKNIVRSHGFYNVSATDCGGYVMRFRAKQSGDWYRVKVNRKGHIVDVDPI